MNSPNYASNPSTPEALDPKLFSQAIGAVSLLINRLGAQPLTLGSYKEQVAPEAFYEIESLSNDIIIGKQAEIIGQTKGLFYYLDFKMFNEVAGAVPSNKDIVAIYVEAHEGIENSTDSSNNSAELGEFNGLIYMLNDGTIEGYLGISSNPSSNPEIQSFMENIVGYFGFEPSEVFDNEKSYDFDNARLVKFIDGMRQLNDFPEL